MNDHLKLPFNSGDVKGSGQGIGKKVIIGTYV